MKLKKKYIFQNSTLSQKY